MKIELAAEWDLAALRRYDRHIPEERLAECVKNGQVYVLRDGAAILGLLRCSLFWQTIPFLDLLFLDETCRGRGYGTRLMQRWEADMARLGYSYVMTSTQADETAQEFYRKLGYDQIGAFLPPEQEADELIFGKKLKPFLNTNTQTGASDV